MAIQMRVRNDRVSKEKDTRKAGEILEEAGKLPIEYQERILAAIRECFYEAAA